ncbi:DUF3035 domain-containing protein [Ascidiaceihabitans sp.]|nr:DUF3035 domain-containing protein [Ascidiaceihabitans sp.]MDB4197694.1 DUF3035 domain-containing protein [Ascidiaceihabitans sp.]
MRQMRPFVISLLVVSLTACANDGLRKFNAPGNGPDDFLVSPSKPLQEPASYAALPAPTPGQGNLVDATPLEDAVAALGGRRDNPNGSIPVRDGAIVQHASRFGVTPNIRAELAAKDAAFRKSKILFTQFRIVKDDLYSEVYKGQSLDPNEIAGLYRKSGIATPTAPLSN